MYMSLGKVLLVDDEERIRRLLKLYLEKEGYEVDEAEAGDIALEMALSGDYDLALLDVMLPGIDGIEVARMIRDSDKKDLPIIMITAKGEEQDRVNGFLTGADDYVVKPFSPREVMLRISSLMSRVKKSNETEYSADSVDYGVLKMFPKSRLLLANEVPVSLTPKEFELLYYLIKSPEKVFSREELLEAVWGYDYYGDLRTIDTHVKRLREKLAVESEIAARMIVTVWGKGYRFSPHEMSRKV